MSDEIKQDLEKQEVVEDQTTIKAPVEATEPETEEAEKTEEPVQPKVGEEQVEEAPATEEEPKEEEKKTEEEPKPEEPSTDEDAGKEPPVDKVKEEPEVIEEQVDIDAIRKELEELKAEKQEKADMEALNKENAKVAREYNQLCDEIGKALEKRFEELSIPLDKTIEDLEKEDRAKAEMAKGLIREANDLIERAKGDATNYLTNKAKDLVFKKADRILKRYDVSEEEAEVVADTFIDIMEQAGIRDLEEDLVAKVELAVARAKMVCKHVSKAANTVKQVAEVVKDKVDEVHDKIEKVEEVIKPDKKEEEITPKVEDVKAVEPEAKAEVVKAPKEEPDTSEFEEGVVGKPQTTASITVENVLEKMASLPYKEQTKFYKENIALVEEALKRGVR